MPESDARRSTGDISSSGTTQTDPSVGSSEGPEAHNKNMSMPADKEKNTAQAREYNDEEDEEEVASHSEKQGQQHGPPPPYSAGFWDKTPAMANARKAYVRVLGGGLFLTTLVIFSVLSIFWGSLWKLNEYIHNLDGWIVVSTLVFIFAKQLNLVRSDEALVFLDRPWTQLTCIIFCI